MGHCARCSVDNTTTTNALSLSRGAVNVDSTSERCFPSTLEKSKEIRGIGPSKLSVSLTSLDTISWVLEGTSNPTRETKISWRILCACSDVGNISK